MEKIQDKREGWGSEGGLFDLDWWYLISTVITIPMAPLVPALISMLHSGNESRVYQYLNLAGKRLSAFQEANWNIQYNEREKTENHRWRIQGLLYQGFWVCFWRWWWCVCVRGGGSVSCLDLWTLILRQWVRDAENTVFQLGPGHRRTQRSLRSGGYPISPVINHCLVMQRGGRCVLLKPADHRGSYFPVLNVCAPRKDMHIHIIRQKENNLDPVKSKIFSDTSGTLHWDNKAYFITEACCFQGSS